jgi:MFS family permease
MPDSGALSQYSASIETRGSWIAACLALAILAVGYGAPLVVVVGLEPIQASLHSDRSVIALAGAMTWVGTGVGGILMGWVADRIGIRATTSIGAAMTGAGLALGSTGSVWALYVGHGLLIGLIGNGALYAPLLVYVSRWFDRRRGTALALISSGQYIAGIVWPTMFQWGIARYGWQATMAAFGAATLVLILPLSLFFLAPAPEPVVRPLRRTAATYTPRVLGLPPNVVQAMLCVASFFCCVPMSLPASHLVAFCTDLGIAPAQGAAMLSVLLGCAFVSRQFWGWVGDRFGGLQALFLGSACMVLAIAAFTMTKNEAGLFAVAAAYGLGFAGIIPSYALTIRALFPSYEASWRIPTLLFTAMSGMAFGSWFAGALYDHFGYYAPAFGVGVIFGIANLILIGALLRRQRGQARLALAAAE